MGTKDFLHIRIVAESRIVPDRRTTGDMPVSFPLTFILITVLAICAIIVFFSDFVPILPFHVGDNKIAKLFLPAVLLLIVSRASVYPKHGIAPALLALEILLVIIVSLAAPVTIVLNAKQTKTVPHQLIRRSSRRRHSRLQVKPRLEDQLTGLWLIDRSANPRSPLESLELLSNGTFKEVMKSSGVSKQVTGVWSISSDHKLRMKQTGVPVTSVRNVVLDRDSLSIIDKVGPIRHTTRLVHVSGPRT